MINLKDLKEYVDTTIRELRKMSTELELYGDEAGAPMNSFTEEDRRKTGEYIKELIDAVVQMDNHSASIHVAASRPYQHTAIGKVYGPVHVSINLIYDDEELRRSRDEDDDDEEIGCGNPDCKGYDVFSADDFDLPEGWVHIQRCDACDAFSCDMDAALNVSMDAKYYCTVCDEFFGKVGGELHNGNRMIKDYHPLRVIVPVPDAIKAGLLPADYDDGSE